MVLALVTALVPARVREAERTQTQNPLVLPQAAPAAGAPKPVVPKPVAPAAGAPKPVAPKPVVHPSNALLGQRIVASARLYLGVPYLWGGTTRAGMDCSGLTSIVLRGVGKVSPRTADQQMRWTTRVSKAEARAGDLVFGVRSDGSAHHVGVYLGHNQMIDAPNAGSSVGVHDLYRDSTVFGRIP
jgi:cell wall-associated NlpC family hydrolase